MKRLLYISVMVLVMLVFAAVLAATSQARTYAWITVGPPSSPTAPGSNFTTDLNVSCWNGIVGALDFNLSYDPDVLHIINFTVPQGSPFYSNLFVNSRSYASGETGVSGFQVSGYKTPLLLGRVTWQVVGASGSETIIEVKPRAVVEGNWSQLEVLSYGQNILIRIPGDVQIDCLVNIIDLASVGLAYGSRPGDSNWNPGADVTGDGVVNIFDLATVGLNYGRTC